MKILVTGGSGFIGSNFIRLMMKKYPDYKIINLDKLTYCGNIENLEDMKSNPRYQSIKGDISDADTVRRAIEGCDAVINFAAESHVDRSIKDPNRFVKTNVHGAMTLLKCAREANIAKFVQIGTDEVYGSIDKGSFTEKSNLNPRSPYSASKAGADLLALSFYATYQLPVVVTRSSNNFGPYQYPEKIVPLFITNALDDEKLPVYGDGMNVRDWLFVLDNCDAIDIVLHKGAIGEVYNVSGGVEIPNMRLTRKILDYLKKPHSLIEFVDDRPGHDRRYSLEAAKIKSLGWKPRHEFEDALKDTIDWYKNNRAWWEPLKKRCAAHEGIKAKTI